MGFLRALAFVVVGVVVGGVAVGGVVFTCTAAHRQEWPTNGSPDWTVVPGLALLVLGPIAGGVAGLVIALRTGRGR